MDKRLIHILLRSKGVVTLGIVFCIVLASCGDATINEPVEAQPTAGLVATPTIVNQATATQAAPPPTVAALPSPSPTAVPNTSSSPTSDDANAQTERLSAKGMEILTKFTEEYSPRASGSDGELAAAEFIGGYLDDMGYRIEYQPVEFDYLPLWSDEFVSLIGDGRPNLPSVPLARTGLGDVTAPIVYVGKAFEDDIPEDGLEGVIAFIERGEITFEEKLNRVSDAGAVAAVIYNNERGIFRGSLQSDGAIPAASLSREDGEKVLQLLEEEPNLRMQVKIKPELINSQNVIAELDDQNDECGVVVIGAHYDSVQNTQAAGDNGTGVASLLVMAEELLDERYDEEQSLPYAIRFVFFGVEEIGLYGSKHYVDRLSEKERQSVIAMLNLDAMGKGEAALVGSPALVQRAIEYAEDNGIDLNRSNDPSGFGSDHAPFLEVDIPALFFFGDDFSIINSPEDVLEEVDPSIMGTHMAVVLGMLQGFECKTIP